MEWVRRRPASALWWFVFLLIGVSLRVWTGAPPGPEYVPTDQDRWVLQRALEQVDQVERVIGHDVDSIDLYDALGIATHFGSPEMVDRVDDICRQHPDPWDAAHAVAAIYRNPVTSVPPQTTESVRDE